jgi:hypothetical protein
MPSGDQINARNKDVWIIRKISLMVDSQNEFDYLRQARRGIRTAGFSLVKKAWARSLKTDYKQTNKQKGPTMYLLRLVSTLYFNVELLYN